jgi:hypothetical protein
MIGYCLFEVFRPVLFGNGLIDILLSFPMNPSQNLIGLYYKTVGTMASSKIVTPVDLGPTFMPIHLLFACLVGWSLFHSEKARIHSDQFKVIPELRVPNKLLWFVSFCIAFYAFLGWGVYDLVYPVHDRINSVWGSYLYSTDVQYLGLSPFQSQLPMFYLSKWIAYLFLIVMQSYMVLYLSYRLPVIIVVVIVCVCSMGRSIFYMIFFGFNFFGLHVKEPDPLGFLSRELYANGYYWGWELIATSSILLTLWFVIYVNKRDPWISK